MNSIYKLKFDRNLQELIVVSELATRSVAKSNLVTLSPDSNLESMITSSSIYDLSLLELVDSIHRVTYSLDSTVSLNHDHYIFDHNLTVDTKAQGNSVDSLGFTNPTYGKYHFANKNLLAVSLLVGSLGLASGAFANTITGLHGQTGEVISGTVSANTVDSVTTITQTTDKAVINWQSFDIKADETLKFVQNSASAAVLNRVTNGQVTNILGNLQADGKVYIVNPNGIIFGKDSHVDVSNLVASTLNISDSNFTDGRNYFEQESGRDIGRVTNLGHITTKGAVALIGGEAINKGILESKGSYVYLLAGKTIEITSLGGSSRVSFKVTAKNKAINLGKFLGAGSIIFGNKVLNGRPSAAMTSTFADVIGADNTNADQASINANGDITLFGGSVSDEMQSTYQNNKEVKGDRNSIVENNGVLNSTTSVYVLGDNIHLGANSKIYSKTTREHNGEFNAGISPYTDGGYVYIGGNWRNYDNNKRSHLTVLCATSLIDNTPVTEYGQSGGIYIDGDKLILDGTINNSNKYNTGQIVITGKDMSFGDDFAFKGGSIIFDTDYLAVVGSDADFTKYVDNQLVSGHVQFTPNLLPDIANIFADPTSNKQVHHYITQDKFINDQSFIELDINRGLVFYNVTNGFDQATRILTSLNNFNNEYDQRAVRVENTNINSEALSFEINGYVNAGTVVDAYSFKNSNISSDRISLFNFENLNIDHSKLKADYVELYYYPYDIVKQDVNINLQIVNGSNILTNTINPHNHIYSGFISNSILTNVNNITIQDSNLISNANITLGTSEAFANSTIININNSNLTATDNIYLFSNVSSFSISDSNFNANNTYIDTYTNIESSTYGSEDVVPADSGVINLTNVNITAQTPTKVNGVQIGKNPATATIHAHNLNITQANIHINAQNLDLTDSSLNATVGNVNLYVGNLETNHLTINSKANVELNNHTDTNAWNLKETNITALAGQVNVTATQVAGDHFNVLAEQTKFNSKNINLAHSNLQADQVLTLTNVNFEKDNELRDVVLTDSSLSANDVNLDLNNNGNFSASNAVITAQNSDINVTTGNIKLTDHTALHTGKDIILNATLPYSTNLVTTAKGLSTNTLTNTLVLDGATLDATSGHINLTSVQNTTLSHSTLTSLDDFTANVNNINLASNVITVNNGGFTVASTGSYTLRDNQVNAKDLINVTAHNNSLVDGNFLQSSVGVNLSTEPGTGTLFFGHNKFNGSKPIKLNVDTPNPLVCLYGKDVAYAYDSYHYHGGICLDQGNDNGVTVVTQDINDTIADNPNNLELTDSLGTIIPVAKRTNAVLELVATCRPRFIALVDKYIIAINDIRYGTEKSLVYKYRLTAEQADFLINCYAKNVDYFSRLRDKNNREI